MTSAEYRELVGTKPQPPAKPPAKKQKDLPPRAPDPPPAPIIPPAPQSSPREAVLKPAAIGGEYSYTTIADVATRCVSILPPGPPDPAYLAEWAALNERYGLRARSTRTFLTDTNGASH